MPDDYEVKILSYIKKCMRKKQCYFKSKHIAEHLGLTSKEVSSRLLIMSHKNLDKVRISKYAYAISTTWKAERC
jgi:hypothetical protein